MPQIRIVISINAAWNILNFRAGLIRGLQAQGHRIVGLAPEDEAAARLRSLGVEYHPLPMDKKGTSPLRDFVLLLRYRRALRRIQPDIFLGFTAKPNIYGSLAAQSLGIKVINNVSGLGTAFIREGLLTRLVSFLYRIAFARSATVFFQNEEDLELFVSRGLVEQGKASLLPGSGIDLRRFVPPAAAPGDGLFRFLLIGRLLWDKGVGEYVEAARRLRSAFPKTRFQLLGFLDVANRTAVPAAEVKAWGEEGLIEYLGQADDVRPFIAAADCIVLPSYREGLPRTLLEGGAMGRPLIATDVPGCRQLVTHGVNGLLCNVRDAAALADAMATMLTMAEQDRWAMGRAARARVEADYDEERVVAAYLDAINR